MSIRCKHCEERVPEWDSRDGCCHQCWEQHERGGGQVVDTDRLEIEGGGQVVDIDRLEIEVAAAGAEVVAGWACRIVAGRLEIRKGPF